MSTVIHPKLLSCHLKLLEFEYAFAEAKELLDISDCEEQVAFGDFIFILSEGLDE